MPFPRLDPFPSYRALRAAIFLTGGGFTVSSWVHLCPRARLLRVQRNLRCAVGTICCQSVVVPPLLMHALLSRCHKPPPTVMRSVIRADSRSDPEFHWEGLSGLVRRYLAGHTCACALVLPSTLRAVCRRTHGPCSLASFSVTRLVGNWSGFCLRSVLLAPLPAMTRMPRPNFSCKKKCKILFLNEIKGLARNDQIAGGMHGKIILSSV